MITENLYMNSHNSWDYRGAWQAVMEFLIKDGLKNWENLIIDYETMYEEKPKENEILIAVNIKHGMSQYVENPSSDDYKLYKDYDHLFQIKFSDKTTVNIITLPKTFNSPDHRAEVANRYKTKLPSSGIYCPWGVSGIEFDQFICGQDLQFDKLELLANHIGVSVQWLLFGEADAI